MRFTQSIAASLGKMKACMKYNLYQTDGYEYVHEKYMRAGLQGKELRTYLSKLWTNFSLVSVLLISAAMEPFSAQTIDLINNGSRSWQSRVVSSFWGAVLVVNSVGLAVVMVQLGYLLAVPPSNEEVAIWWDSNKQDVGAPAYWTLCGTAAFVVAVLVHCCIAGFTHNTSSGDWWASTPLVVATAFLFFVGVFKGVRNFVRNTPRFSKTQHRILEHLRPPKQQQWLHQHLEDLEMRTLEQEQLRLLLEKLQRDRVKLGQLQGRQAAQLLQIAENQLQAQQQRWLAEHPQQAEQPQQTEQQQQAEQPQHVTLQCQLVQFVHQCMPTLTKGQQLQSLLRAMQELREAVQRLRDAPQAQQADLPQKARIKGEQVLKTLESLEPRTPEQEQLLQLFQPPHVGQQKHQLSQLLATLQDPRPLTQLEQQALQELQEEQKQPEGLRQPRCHLLQLLQLHLWGSLDSHRRQRAPQQLIGGTSPAAEKLCPKQQQMMQHLMRQLMRQQQEQAQQQLKSSAVQRQLASVGGAAVPAAPASEAAALTAAVEGAAAVMAAAVAAALKEELQPLLAVVQTLVDQQAQKDGQSSNAPACEGLGILAPEDSAWSMSYNRNESHSIDDFAC